MTTAPYPDWDRLCLDPSHPRDRAMGFRSLWPQLDREAAIPIDSFEPGDKVWRADALGLRVEEGVVVGLKQVLVESNGDVRESKIGCHVEFLAAFGPYNAYVQTYQWKFYDSPEKAWVALKGLAKENVRAGEAALARAKTMQALIEQGEYDIRRYDKAGRILRDTE